MQAAISGLPIYFHAYESNNKLVHSTTNRGRSSQLGHMGVVNTQKLIETGQLFTLIDLSTVHAYIYIYSIK